MPKSTESEFCMNDQNPTNVPNLQLFAVVMQPAKSPFCQTKFLLQIE